MDIVADFKKEGDTKDITLKDFFISIWTFYMAGNSNVPLFNAPANTIFLQL